MRRLPARPALMRACLIGLLVLCSGCGFTYHFQDAKVLRGEEHNEWASYFLFGIVGDHEIDVREFCPNGVHEITTGTNFLTWLVSTLTIGIYTPRKVNIWCAGGPRTTSFEVDFGRDGKPSYVTKHEGRVTYSGTAEPVGDGRYGVALREGGAQ